MSVEAMTMVTISGPENMVDTALRNLVVNRQFHPENAIKALSGVKKLMPFDTVNPFSEALAKAVETARLLKIKPEYRDFSLYMDGLEEASEYVNALHNRIVEQDAEEDSLRQSIQKNGVLSEQLGYFSGFDVGLSELFNMEYVKFRFGRLPEEEYKEVSRMVNERPDVFYIASVTAEHWVYGGYFALFENYSQVDALFSSLGFERIHLDMVENSGSSTVPEIVERIKNEQLQAKQRITEIAAERKAMAEEKEKLLMVYSWLRFMNDAFELRAYSGYRHAKFYLVGWVPEALAEDYAKECESYEGFSCALTPAREKRTVSPPVKLKKNFLSGIYEPFVEMYGLPARGEMDPRLFMAITYTILFGIMFGDVGQGAFLVIVGFLLWKLKGMWLGRIVSLCGVSAAAFGFVYGSVFGNEDILPGFKVLEDGNTMRILIIAVALGVLLILICMILNIINGIRQRDIKKIFFEPNGLAGFILYAGIAFGVVWQVLKGQSVFTLPYILLVIVLPLLLIFAATPVTKLLTGQKDWKPESIGMFIVEGFFELFETMLSYVSNTVSFLRVGAFAISHAGMMMVVYLLSGSDNIVGLVFGNLLVTGLETVLVCIQVMRLQFYEMFGRFYESGGVKYSPRIIDYSQI